MLELYKNVDGLARAWRPRRAAAAGAELRLVGRGPRHAVVEELVRDLPAADDLARAPDARGGRHALDESTCLVLPSRSEGLGRVLVEAFLRARPAVAMGVGGIRDVVEDGVSGLLVQSDDELADALVRILSDRELAERLAAGAHASGGRWVTTPDEFADRLAEVVAATSRSGAPAP